MKTYKLLNAIRYVDARTALRFIDASVNEEASNAIAALGGDKGLVAILKMQGTNNSFSDIIKGIADRISSGIGLPEVLSTIDNVKSAVKKLRSNSSLSNKIDIQKFSSAMDQLKSQAATKNRELKGLPVGSTAKERKAQRSLRGRGFEAPSKVAPRRLQFPESPADVDLGSMPKKVQPKTTVAATQRELERWGNQIPGKMLLPKEGPKEKFGLPYQEEVVKASGYNGPFRSENEQEKRIEAKWRAEATATITPKEEQRAETAMLVKKLTGGDPTKLDIVIPKLNENRKRELKLLIEQKKGFEGAKRQATIAIKKMLGLYSNKKGNTNPNITSRWKESEDREKVIRAIAKYGEKIKKLSHSNPKAGRAFNNFYTMVTSKGFSTKEAKYFHDFISEAGRDPNNVWASELAKAMTAIRDGYKRKLQIYKERSEGKSLTPQERKDLWLIINDEIKQYIKKLEAQEEARRAAKIAEEKDRAAQRAAKANKDSFYTFNKRNRMTNPICYGYMF